MYSLAADRIAKLSRAGLASRLRTGKRGLEKECLRIRRDGSIAQTPHPAAWGSALTHPYITTDYSEALAEFITPAFDRTEEVLRFLHEVHQFAYAMLPGDELLWASSMPCALKDDSLIPIARYGTSNTGKMKHAYRVGLDYRYGRRMQAIAGVHFNYSLPLDFWPGYREVIGSELALRDFMDDHYFGLIRNFRRIGWLVPLLFGNSPVVCSSFLAGRTSRFKKFDECSHYLPYATSLRMSDVGYKNKNQAALAISYDGLAPYVDSLSRAIATPYPEYEVMGLYDGEERIQLNTNILQIENEFYSYMRPKRTTRSGERPTLALRERGVEYVEMRALDVYSYSPTGVDEEHLLFLEAFLIFCLLADSPRITGEEQWGMDYNELTVAMRGREPDLLLIRDGVKVPLAQWAQEILIGLMPICEILDEGAAEPRYVRALQQQMAILRTPDELPSARVLRELQQRRQTFFDYTLEQAAQHERHFRERPLRSGLRDHFNGLAAASIAEQKALEANDKLDFDTYIARYFADPVTD
jgi:glutamate--cysteine ligase